MFSRTYTLTIHGLYSNRLDWYVIFSQVEWRYWVLGL